MRSLALLALLVPVPALAAEPFDLVCEGERQTELDGPAEKHSYGVRIDLDNGKWCWDHCEQVYDIEEVQPDRLILMTDDTKTRSKSRYFRNVIDRTNGQHEMVSIETRPLARYMRTVGQCERAPFSGFPEAKF